MKIVIFSGTSEGRSLSHAVADLGAEVLVCVATEYGRVEQGTYPGTTVHTGRMETPAMAALLQDAALCVDATHPYAEQATANIRAAAQAAGVACRRLLRPASPLPRGCQMAANAAEAAALLQGTDGNVLLTTGAKELAAFAPLGGERLYPRVLPLPAALDACAAAGIPPRNIIAMQGPFSEELNLALMRQFSIRYLVTKDGGAAGGFAEKLAAAQKADVVPVVIRRPPETGEDYETVLQECRALLTGK